MEKSPFVPEPFIPRLATEEFDYALPAERIAAYPLADRASSKLLVAELSTNDAAAHCTIAHKQFRDIVDVLPTGAMLVMNDSRVIAARIQMHKTSGGAAELLCLQPVFPSIDPAVTMLTEHSCRWLCMVGGRNIHDGMRLVREHGEQHDNDQKVQLTATILSKQGMEALVEFTWTPEQMSFAEVLDTFGEMPLPPYIKRNAEPSDKERYQTVYAAHEGSVAAPTAGLHFTTDVLKALQTKGVTTERLTLHVGAGTFKPMTSEQASDHEMHFERIAVSRRTVEALAEQARRRKDAGGNHIVAVGTTSMRTLESLYWWGVRLMINDGDARKMTELMLAQWDAYRLQAWCEAELEGLPSPALALHSIAAWMHEHGLATLTGETQMMIVPTYPFMLCDALVTNFHQPHSTLILLVAAFLTDAHGNSHWREVYDAALADTYRFLSYGDSSLLIVPRER
jgi:S-adenosylmethionine:tRNA ribosyltransferase-isomerase